jgi:tetratricopeptide (TPR) repeat protein
MFRWDEASRIWGNLLFEGSFTHPETGALERRSSRIAFPMIVFSRTRFMPLLAIWVFCHGLTGLASGQQLDLEQVFDERNLEPVGRILDGGDYELVARIAEMAIKRGQKAPRWRQFRLFSLCAIGQIEQALDESATFGPPYSEDLALLMIRHDLALALGKKEMARTLLNQFNSLAKGKPAKERTAEEMVAMGKAALALGLDAQKVLSQFFDPAKRKDAKLEAPYLAAGELALEKEDYTRAADEFRLGLKEHGETANLRLGLAKAFASSDREKTDENLKRVFEINPKHAGMLLLRAEQLMGAEKFLEAEAAIQSVIDIDEGCPEAWALRSAICLILADEKRAKSAHSEAMKRWSENPKVDHIIGRCLSRAYRFAEAAVHQRAALALDEAFLPAKVQLCHTLMRLGVEEEAWKLAAEIRASDGYNLQAHNLGLLEKEISKYATQRFDDFVIRLPERDWQIYGERALALLRDAKSVLCDRYGLELKRPVLVEFFPTQQDFAIRTFGNLGGQGILGACFGSVVTMNSPGGLAHGRNNWEATLWHEFCHVVTLTVTKNRMPRWLSEGISVYEESQRNPAWGMEMTARYRSMILDEEALTPISQLSSAFLSPEGEDGLMFAYFESSRVVKFLIEKFGKERFQGILRDLADGKRINDAISNHTLPIDQIENEFAQVIMREAKAFGSEADWERPTPEELNPTDAESLASFLEKNPTNLWALGKSAQDLLESKEWIKAAKIGDKLIELNPADMSSESGYVIKANALRHLNQEEEEAALLRYFAARASDAMPVFLRLIELDSAAGRWDEVLINGARASALNPFLKTPQQAMATALMETGDTAEAAKEFMKLLVLEPDNPADVKYRLARLLRAQDPIAAKRHLIDALVLAPRFREAHMLLQEMEAPTPKEIKP